MIILHCVKQKLKEKNNPPKKKKKKILKVTKVVLKTTHKKNCKTIVLNCILPPSSYFPFFLECLTLLLNGLQVTTIPNNSYEGEFLSGDGDSLTTANLPRHPWQRHFLQTPSWSCLHYGTTTIHYRMTFVLAQSEKGAGTWAPKVYAFLRHILLCTALRIVHHAPGQSNGKDRWPINTLISYGTLQ